MQMLMPTLLPDGVAILDNDPLPRFLRHREPASDSRSERDVKGLRGALSDLWGGCKRVLATLTALGRIEREGREMTDDMTMLPPQPGAGSGDTGDNALMRRVEQAAQAFGAVEGERMLNALLHQMLRASDLRLQGYGVKVTHATAELASLHSQLARAREANENGRSEYAAMTSAVETARAALRGGDAAAASQILDTLLGIDGK